MLTWGSTQYSELAHQGYPQETLGQQVSEATRVLLVPWEARQQAALDFLGYVEADPAGNPPFPSRVIPSYHPSYLRADGQPYLWADSVTFEPYGQTQVDGTPLYGGDSNIDWNDAPLYAYAKMTVHYSTRLYRIFDDGAFGMAAGGVGEASLLRYVEMPFATSAQYLTLPDGTFQVAQDGNPPAAYDINGNAVPVALAPVPGAPGKIEGQWDVTLIWRQVPRSMIASAGVQYPVSGAATQQAAFDYAIGHVNSVAFAGYPAGTLLCEPMELQQWVQADGEIVFDVTFHFKYYARGWNYFLTKGTDGKLYYPEIAVAAGNPPAATYVAPDAPPPPGVLLYDSYDFHNLFYGYAATKGVNPSP